MQQPRAGTDAGVPLLAEHREAQNVVLQTEKAGGGSGKSVTSGGCWCFGDYKDGFPSIADSVAEICLPQWVRQRPAALGMIVTGACFGLFLLIGELQMYSQEDEGMAKLVRRLSGLSLFCGYSSLAASYSSLSLLGHVGAVANGVSAVAAFALASTADATTSWLLPTNLGRQSSGAASSVKELAHVERAQAGVQEDVILNALKSAAVVDARCLSRAAMDILDRIWATVTRTAESPHQTVSRSFFVWQFQRRDARFWALMTALLVIGAGLGYALALVSTHMSRRRTGRGARVFIQVTGVIAAAFFVACVTAAIFLKKCHLWLLEASVIFSLLAAGPELLQDAVAQHKNKSPPPSDIEVASTM